MRRLHHPNPEDILLTDVLYALGDPVRLAIAQRLAQEGALPCCELGAAVPKSTLSHHLRIMREAGLLHCHKEGTQHINSLRRADLNARFPGLLDQILDAAMSANQPAERGEWQRGGTEQELNPS